MSLFEKIFNYQLISRLDESGAFATTSQERSWLRTMLADTAAEKAFLPVTLAKLRSLLEEDEPLDPASALAEKAGLPPASVFHPLIPELRTCIVNHAGIRISFRLRNGKMHEDLHGFPYKLEFSMVKRDWSLLWYNMRHRSFMCTKLENIVSVREMPLDPEQAAQLAARIDSIVDSRREQAVLEIVPLYNPELSRILYAFSCFEKDVVYLDETDTYRMTVTYQADESEYVLSKIRFLGKRVKVVEGSYLLSRLRETASKALARYGVT
ncbi:WYL domain-containing protein [Paenibacillus terreus]|uniref:WYL domain-containing protein n=1 Tax=Paenibacillus terreus TaxID=1387834 RepID=A0ABV5B587_9BACL